MRQLRNIDAVIRKAYEPTLINESFYKKSWKKFYEKGHMKESAVPYTICLPPPNITGSLHLGHALTVAIEDALIRWNHKLGRATTWIPGCDHASIATQVAVEKHIAKTENLTRLNIGREKFITHVMKWKEFRENEIHNQLQKMGTLLNWEKYRFTMDKGYSEAVVEAFYRLNKSGRIYRKQSFVNWCPHLKSTVSDIEVDSLEINGPTELSIPSSQTSKIVFGEHLSVSTTRPETILGDVALAVHPNDTRYSSFIGKYAHHPIFPQRLLEIVPDVGVDPEFGTGVVKVTPAHDPLDFEIWQRREMGKDKILDVFDDSANINDGFGDFSGLSRYQARDKIISMLNSMGQMVSVTDHKQILPVCSRSGDIIEPRLRHQWFVACQGRLVERAIKVAETGELKFYPEFYKSVWLHWLTNIKDWCISRQLWWGHRIPAYRIKGESLINGDCNWIVARSVQEARSVANLDESVELEQDEDVLDTWFSSGLYPLASQGWPENTPEVQTRYPISLMETGADILFFWVARMVMLCSELAPNQGQLPFKNVLLHGIVRDATGRKMSKSLGNVIDPLDTINGATLKQLQSRYTGPADAKLRSGQARLYPKGIPECGADGLRLALCLYDTHTTDINIDVGHLAASRRFANKLWQAVRFVLMHTPEDFRYEPQGVMKLPRDDIGLKHPVDGWLLTRLNEMKQACHAAFSEKPVAVKSNSTGKTIYLPPLRIHGAASAVKNFVHHDLCDTYIEYVKNDLKGEDEDRNKVVHGILYKAISDSLDYLHPFMPFVTEELSHVVRKIGQMPKIESILEVELDRPLSEVDQDWKLSHGNINVALECVYSARSAVALTANAVNQFAKKSSEKSKPSYNLSVPTGQSDLNRAFISTFSRLLPNIEILEHEEIDRIFLNLHEKCNARIFLQEPNARLLHKELERRRQKLEKERNLTNSNKKIVQPSAIELLQEQWWLKLNDLFK